MAEGVGPSFGERVARAGRNLAWGVALLVLPAACALTVAGFFAAHGRLASLCSPFRVQYAIVLSTGIAVLALRRRWKLVLVLGAFLGANAMEIAPCYIPPSLPAAAGPARAVHILAFNVDFKNPNYEALASYVEREAPDVLALVEMTPACRRALAGRLLRLPHYAGEARDDPLGVGIFSRFPLAAIRFLRAGEGRSASLAARLEGEGGGLVLVVTHPVHGLRPPSYADRQAVYRTLVETVPGLGRPIALVGDLNATPWCPGVRRLCAALALRDSTRGHGIQVTWPTAPALAVLRIPIDHCLVSEGIAVTSRRVGPPMGSDHFPLHVALAVK